MNSSSLEAVSLRVTVDPLADAVLSASALPQWQVATSPRAGPIAIVDDDKWILKSMERLVKSAGFKVETFISAEESLEAGKDSARVCVVLDIGLPGMRGLDLQRHLSAENSQVRIIFVSAHDETEMRTQALAGGAIAFVSKPVNDKALLDAVDSAVK